MNAIHIFSLHLQLWLTCSHSHIGKDTDMGIFDKATLIQKIMHKEWNATHLFNTPSKTRK
jgi:hypothetical protein